jgi:DNA-binding LacI/PurR family transcriptional regulator
MTQHPDQTPIPLPRARVTVKDVAAKAGVSTAAVSQALNGRGALSADTRKRILDAASDLGYSPDRYAAALRRGRTLSIGYVASPPLDPVREAAQAQYAMRQLSALVDAAAAHQFTVTVIPSARPELLRSARVDAVYAPDARESDPLLAIAAAQSIPVITNDLPLPPDAGMWIRTGYEDAATAALDLLAASGATNIGLLTGEPGLPRLEIGETVYAQWCADRGQAPIVARVDAASLELAGSIRELLLEGVDGLFSFAPEGPRLFLDLTALDVVLPRDLQLVALCLHDCALNRRLSVTHVCVHPERAPQLLFPELVAALESASTPTSPVVLPWELVGGSTTRSAPTSVRRGTISEGFAAQANVP